MIRTAALLLSGLALGASGDAIYRFRGPTVQITGAQALPFATQAIAVGAYSGAAANLQRICVQRSPGADSLWKTPDDRFAVQVNSFGLIPPADVLTVLVDGTLDIIGVDP